MNQPPLLYRFKEGDRVIRNPATWNSLAKFFPDLGHPRAGFGVGVILNLGWDEFPIRDRPFTIATVRWGRPEDLGTDIVSVPLRYLLPAPMGAVDDRDYSDPDVLWEAFDEACEEVSGGRLTPLIALHLRPLHTARLEEERGARPCA